MLWSLKKWLMQGLKGGVEGRTFEQRATEGKCSLMKLGKMQVTGFLILHVHLHAPRPPFPPPKQNKKFNRRGLFITTELFASEMFPVLIFGAIYSFSPLLPEPKQSSSFTWATVRVFQLINLPLLVSPK